MLLSHQELVHVRRAAAVNAAGRRAADVFAPQAYRSTAILSIFFYGFPDGKGFTFFVHIVPMYTWTAAPRFRFPMQRFFPPPSLRFPAAAIRGERGNPGGETNMCIRCIKTVHAAQEKKRQEFTKHCFVKDIIRRIHKGMIR